MLTAEGVAVEPHPWLPDCLFLNGTGSLEHLQAFQKGYFYIQDAAAHLAVLAAAPQPGWRVLDACRSPWRQILRRRYRHGEPGERHLL